MTKRTWGPPLAFFIIMAIVIALILGLPLLIVAVVALAVAVTWGLVAEFAVNRNTAMPASSPGGSTETVNIAASTSIVHRPMMDEEHGVPGSGGNSTMRWTVGMAKGAIDAATGRPMALAT